MAQNTLKAYCDAIKKGKNLEIIIGRLHTQGIKEHLESALKNKVKISINDISTKALTLEKKHLKSQWAQKRLNQKDIKNIE